MPTNRALLISFLLFPATLPAIESLVPPNLFRDGDSLCYLSTKNRCVPVHMQNGQILFNGAHYPVVQDTVLDYYAQISKTNSSEFQRIRNVVGKNSPTLAEALDARVSSTSVAASAGAAGSHLQSETAASRCPEWLAGGLPKCPRGGGVLSSNYPIAANIISVAGNSDEATSLTAKTIVEMLTAAGDKPPAFFLPVDAAVYQKISGQVRTAALADPKKAELWSSALNRVDGPINYNWTQDYVIPTFDPASGQAVLQNVGGYPWSTQSKQFDSSHVDHMLAQIAGTCDRFKVGATLPDAGAQINDKRFLLGGNVLAIPGGHTLTGTQPPGPYVSRFARSTSAVDTSWLMVGHIDEIVGVVPNRNAKQPCDFALTVASPAKAIETFGDPENKDKYLYQDTAIWNSPYLNDLCEIALARRSVPTRNAPIIHGYLRMFDALVANAVAESSRDCAGVTVNEVALALREGNSSLKIINDLVQLKMNTVKDQLRNTLKQTHPECHINILDVPNLFGGAAPVVKDQVYQLPDRLLKALNPNPTNAIVVQNSILVPDQKNSALTNVLTKTFSDLGLTPRFIDNFTLQHKNDGNLHCSVNSIRTCEGRQIR